MKEFKQINVEIQKITVESPLKNLKIGDDFNYKGIYIHGYEEGKSKIKGFFKKVPFWDGVERKINENTSFPILMELENDKIVLIGYIEYNGIRILQEFL
jgi:hypothetical protein